MTMLHPPATPTRQLHWDAEERKFIGEASCTNGFGRVYDDACDEGMTLVSAKTGREIVFAVTRTHRDADGDITMWELEVADQPHQAVPATFVDAKIVLFND